MRIRILMAIGLFAFLSSCIKSQDKWYGDYYSYSFGAYINGVEFHDILPSFGFSHEGYDYYFYRNARDKMIDVFWGGWSIDLYSNPKKDGPSYGLHFELVFNSDLTDGTCIYYQGLTENISIRDVFYNPDSLYHGIPLVSGYLGLFPPYEDHHVFWITSGSISFGSLDYFKINGTVTFEFEAENDLGEVLVVKEGYCNSDVSTNATVMF